VRGPAAAPPVIRSALFDPEANAGIEDGRTLFADERFVDAGDLDLPAHDPAGVFAAIESGVAGLLSRDARVVGLGGDHSVSHPLVKATHAALGVFSVVQIDAHPDLYDDFEGDRFSHACPFARIMESGLADRLVQIGIRAPTPHQGEQARRFGVERLDVVERDGLDRLPDGPVYLSVDLDGLDPAFVPGVSHPEPGGLTVREVIRVIHALPGPLIGADVVEYNPRRDICGATALVAAKLVKEIAGRVLRDAPAHARHE
jgi:agmatinase